VSIASIGVWVLAGSWLLVLFFVVGGLRRRECWSLGRMLAGGTNIQILSSAKDLKEFWPNVGLLVCWSFPVSVFVKKG
jgi:hypothetical protein